MAKQVKFRRGTTAQTNAFTGALAEVTVDTDKDTVVVHDGATAGGFSMAAVALADGSIAVKKRDGTTQFTVESDGDLTFASATAMDANTTNSVPMTRSIQGAEAERLTIDRKVLLHQPTPATFAASATLTVANLNSRILTYTGGTAQTLTLPTGTALEALSASPAMATDSSFDFHLIVTGSAVSVAANTGVTLVGNFSPGANTSATFRLRKTATNTFVAYRVG